MSKEISKIDNKFADKTRKSGGSGIKYIIGIILCRKKYKYSHYTF